MRHTRRFKSGGSWAFEARLQHGRAVSPIIPQAPPRRLQPGDTAGAVPSWGLRAEGDGEVGLRGSSGGRPTGGQCQCEAPALRLREGRPKSEEHTVGPEGKAGSGRHGGEGAEPSSSASSGGGPWWSLSQGPEAGEGRWRFLPRPVWPEQRTCPLSLCPVWANMACVLGPPCQVTSAAARSVRAVLDPFLLLYISAICAWSGQVPGATTPLSSPLACVSRRALSPFPRNNWTHCTGAWMRAG